MRYQMFVNNKVKFYRNERGFSTKQLASYVGTSELTLIEIEDNHYNCSINLACRLSIALEVPLGDLFKLELNS